MCGIAGFINTEQSVQNLQLSVSDMVALINHRGPDDNGVWVDEQSLVALGHARLSIMDLSPHGHQPMVSERGRFVLVFNGEIYNYRALRRELESHRDISWRGHSDTEVILAAVEQWGFPEFLGKLNGMFAIALYDSHTKQLHIARDRMGEKPLYYGNVSGGIAFTSELKTLKALGGRLDIDRDALSLYFRHNYIPNPYSIYQNVFKLQPGHYLTINVADIKAVNPDMAVAYWDIRKIAFSGSNNLLGLNGEEAVDLLEEKLLKSVSSRMESDVPLGAFLSGGYDSSVVAALMQASSSSRVKTFSIGFNEEGYNEAHYAKAVAEHLGTEHTEMYVSQQQAMDVIPNLAKIYCEPFSDSSQIPTYLVSTLAKRSVTVALSGDGGDELFAGYNRYFFGDALWRKLSRLPSSLREVTASGIHRISPGKWDSIFSAIAPLLPGRFRYSQFGDKLHKLANTLAYTSPDSLYRSLVSHWSEPSNIVLGASEPLTALTDSRLQAELASFIDKMMYLDQVSYLPDDILTKVDRASMAVSLETRVPLLDHELVELAWQLPQSLKVRDGKGKWILREVLHRHIPREIMERPKMGFGIPIDQWLRGNLREWAESLLDKDLLASQGYLNPDPIRTKWAEHISGKRNWSYHLWDVLMFQAWLEAYS